MSCLMETWSPRHSGTLLPAWARRSDRGRRLYSDSFAVCSASTTSPVYADYSCWRIASPNLLSEHRELSAQGLLGYGIS